MHGSHLVCASQSSMSKHVSYPVYAKPRRTSSKINLLGLTWNRLPVAEEKVGAPDSSSVVWVPRAVPNIA